MANSNTSAPIADDFKFDVFAPPGQDVVIRRGDALPLANLKDLVRKGVITTPGDWYENRMKVAAGQIEPAKSHVVANYTSRIITLFVNEQDPFGTYSIQGSLKPHPDLEKFAINKVTTYSSKDLYDKLKFLRAYFKDKDSHTSLLLNLQKFKGKIEIAFENSNDYKGSAATQKLTEIKLNEIGKDAMKFTLGIPIFAGFKPKEIPVEILCDLHNGQVVFWLESIELREMEIMETERIFEEQAKRFEPLMVVEKWEGE